MLSYSGLNTYSTDSVEKSVKAIVVLDLNEKSFVLGLLADLEQAHPSRSIADHSFYKGKILAAS